MTIAQAMLRGALALGCFALITAGSVGLTRALTAERIETNQLAFQHRQLREVLPDPLEQLEGHTLLDGAFRLPEASSLGHKEAEAVEGWRVHEGNHQALILPVVSRQGYSGAIHLLVGLDQNARISGVRVTYHQETPGLGDKIERRKSAWITRFNGLSLESLTPSGWAVDKDGGAFDSFSGATITPRAVVSAVHQALLHVEEHQLLDTFEESSP